MTAGEAFGTQTGRPTGRRIGQMLGLLAGALAVLAAALAFAAAGAAQARSVHLDRSFGHRGKALTSFEMPRVAQLGSVDRIAALPDGEFLVSGRGSEGTGFVVARLDADGRLDRGFGTGGMLETGYGSTFAVAPGGGIVVGGQAGDGRLRTDLVIGRYRADGAPVKGFGHRGRVRIDIGVEDSIDDLAVQPGGSIIAGASTYCPGAVKGCGYSHTSALALRLSARGKVKHRQGVAGTGIGFTAVRPGGDLYGIVYGDLEDEAPAAIAHISRRGRISVVGHVLSSAGSAPRELALAPGGGFLLGRGVPGIEVQRLGSDSRPDPGFGDGGTFTCHDSSLSDSGMGTRFGLDSRGRILAIGGGGDCGLVRLTPTGRLDPTFGDGGEVEVDPSGADGYESIAALAGGGAVLAGWDHASGSIRVARYRADGSLDSGFGDGGVAFVSPRQRSKSSASAVLRSGGGTITAAGTTICPGQTDPYRNPCMDMSLARYRGDGRLLRGFGRGGRVLTDFGGLDTIAAAVRAPGGKVIAVGRGGHRDNAFASPKAVMMAVRYLPDGSLDPTFGDGGAVRLPLGVGGGYTGSQDETEADSVRLRPNGKIVIGGSRNACGTNCAQAVVVQLKPDGELDPSFGDGGYVTLDRGGFTRAGSIDLGPGGSIVGNGYPSSPFTVFRLRRDGEPDPNFGRDGIARMRIAPGGRATGGTGKSATVEAVEALPGGKVLAAGERFDGHMSGVLARFRADGKVDRRFGRRGMRILHRFIPADIATDRCGRILMAGRSRPSGGHGRAFALAAVGGRGGRAAGFGHSGIRKPFGSAISSATALAIGAGGRVTAAGWRNVRSGGRDFALARYSAGGCARR